MTILDRIACPWLIRRFADPDAAFLFVPPGEVEGVAEKFGAAPFGIEGVFWSHRGEDCTFDTMLAEFDLQSEALSHLTGIAAAVVGVIANLAFWFGLRVIFAEVRPVAWPG